MLPPYAGEPARVQVDHPRLEREPARTLNVGQVEHCGREELALVRADGREGEGEVA